MNTLTEEQFNQKYGPVASLKIEQTDANRFPDKAATKDPFVNRFTNFIGLGGATDVYGKLMARSSIGSALLNQTQGAQLANEATGTTMQQRTQEFIDKPTPGQIAGAALQTAAIPAGFALTGGASTAGQVAMGAGLGYAYDVGQDLIQKKTVAQTLTPGLSTAIGVAAPLAIAGASALRPSVENIVESTSQAVGRATQAVPESQALQGASQTVSDLADRVPRFIARQQENIAEQATKRQAIQTASSPAIANAVRVELPEKFVNTVSQADEPTRQAFKRVVEMAEEVPKTIGVKNNPTIVGGELASKQYEIIENQRKSIGNAIGEQVKQLGLDKAKVDMRVGLNQIDDVLSQQGIKIAENGKLAFTGKYTPAERARIQELYTLAKESGDVLTPLQVRDMDQLFSKLQRETRMEGLGDLRVDVNGQNMSMFRVFRDVYANQLENLSPELRKLNSQYRNISTLIEDIEDSIVKTPNFNVTKSTDPAEFAKVNLRRIFGESQSSPAFEAIADEMDTISRQLGYIDAKPKDVAAFAQELRELYPEITPRTGFQGGFRAGLADIAEKVLGAGQVTEVDKREALKKLLEETTTSTK